MYITPYGPDKAYFYRAGHTIDILMAFNNRIYTELVAWDGTLKISANSETGTGRSTP